MNIMRNNRTNNNKPVNISISFTINPKNIVNQQTYGIDSHIKTKKCINQYHTIDKQYANNQIKTPQLLYTQRTGIGNDKDYFIHPDDKKIKKNRKGHSVDQTSLTGIGKKAQGQKSLNLYRQPQSIHIRKPSLKTKRQYQTTTKRNHNKTISKESVNQNTAFKSYGVENVSMLEQKYHYRKNLKNMINKMITNQLSKRSLTASLPPHQNRPLRKKRINYKKHPREGKTQNLISKYWREQDFETMKRQTIIQKLTSIRSMNECIFNSQQDEQPRPRQRRTMVINTDHSIDCIDQIHELQKQARYQSRGSEVQKYDIIKVKQTKNLIQYHIAMLNQHMENYSDSQDQKKEGILHVNHQSIEKEEIKHRQKQLQHNRNQNNEKKSQNVQSDEDQNNQQSYSNNEDGSVKKKTKQKLKVSEFQPFISSQMTKQQKIISEIQRAKLNELKKHEVQKWGQLLTFIRSSMKQGKTNHDEILQNIYNFLQQSKIDLQNDLPKQKIKSPIKNKNQIEESNKNINKKQIQVQIIQNQQQIIYPSISLISPKNYQQQNQQLKLMNLSMIQNALKQRHDCLLDKKNKQIINLQQKKNIGKISQALFISQCQKLQKWTKKQTTQIMQARKTIWKGYNEAKGIIEKSLKSKYFQQQNAKKKSMMKCLSEDYLLKNYNYKKLLKPQQSQQNKNQIKKIQKKQQHHEIFHHHQQKLIPQQSKNQSQSSSFLTSELQQNVLFLIPQQKIGRATDHQQISKNVKNAASKNIKPNNVQEEGSDLKNGKQIIQFTNLSLQDDINVIKQKLLQMKNKHLQQDLSSKIKYSQIIYQQPKKYVREGEEQQISQSQIKLINKELGKQQKIPVLPIDKSQRLKYILPQDKQDIFQFIFLDLSIEIYQEPCHDNKIMDCINNYVAYIKRQTIKKKGVKTNLAVVKQYLKRMSGYILRVHKDVLNSLDTPVGPSALQMLKYMHDNDQDPIDYQGSINQLVIPTKVFQMFQKIFLPSVEFQVYYQNDEEKEVKRVEFLKNVLHIHNKALFDSMNQYLDLLRPFGIWGIPFPWKSSSNFLHNATGQQKEQKLRKGTQKVVQNCSYVCGLLADKQQSLLQNTKYSTDYIQQLKQDRLSRMLAAQLVQNEQRWLFYDDQQTEVLVEVSKDIFIMIIKQLVHENLVLFYRNLNF